MSSLGRCRGISTRGVIEMSNRPYVTLASGIKVKSDSEVGSKPGKMSTIIHINEIRKTFLLSINPV